VDAAAVAARLVAVLLAALGTRTLVLGGHAYDADQLTTAFTLFLTAIGLAYSAVRTWRAKTLKPRPPGVAVKPEHYRSLLARSSRLAVIERTGFREQAVPDVPSPPSPGRHSTLAAGWPKPRPSGEAEGIDDIIAGTKPLPGREGDEP
jgi:hypothetical protein